MSRPIRQMAVGHCWSDCVVNTNGPEASISNCSSNQSCCQRTGSALIDIGGMLSLAQRILVKFHDVSWNLVGLKILREKDRLALDSCTVYEDKECKDTV